MAVNVTKGKKGFQKSTRTPVTREGQAILAFSRQECGELLLELMFMDRDQLLALYNERSTPMVKQIIAGCLLRARKTQNFNLINEMWDRAIGRIGEEITIRTNSTFEEYLLMGPEQRALKRAEMLEAVRIMRQRDIEFNERMKTINGPEQT